MYIYMYICLYTSIDYTIVHEYIQLYNIIDREIYVHIYIYMYMTMHSYTYIYINKTYIYIYVDMRTGVPLLR